MRGAFSRTDCLIFSRYVSSVSLRCVHIKMAALYELCAATNPSPDVPSPERCKVSKTTAISRFQRIQPLVGPPRNSELLCKSRMGPEYKKALLHELCRHRPSPNRCKISKTAGHARLQGFRLKVVFPMP